MKPRCNGFSLPRKTKVNSLSECRKEIDEIDSRLLELLERRIRVAESVARYKIENDMKVFDEGRERAVLEDVAARCPEDVRAEIAGTFDGIMNMSKLHQYRLKSKLSPSRKFFSDALKPVRERGTAYLYVGVQGVPGAYSEMSARRLYPEAHIEFYPDFAGIFEALKRGDIDFGVLPVENSTYGSVTDVYRLIIDNDAYIAASDRLRVEHCLLGLPGVTVDEIREVTSHPQALGQCAGYISAHGFTETAAANTAVAAEKVAKSGRRELAAIARVDCAENYGLRIIEKGIQDEPHNTTRFVSISNRLSIPSGADKISIRFSLEHRQGTLARILGYFAALGLNLTKLESRPIPSKPFNYLFYIDFVGSMRDEAVFDLVCALNDELAEFRFMGNYHEYENDK